MFHFLAARPGNSLKAVLPGQSYGLHSLFLFSRDCCPSSTDVQYFEIHCYVYFVLFCFAFIMSNGRLEGKSSPLHFLIF